MESLHSALRGATKTRGSFPNEEATQKPLDLAIHDASKKWQIVAGCGAALNHSQILWTERIAPLEGGCTRMISRSTDR